MPTKKLPPLYNLSPGQILELVRDLHRFSSGYKIILAVDCADIIDYCYPINPNDQPRDIDPESLAESQIALHHLFRVDEPENLSIVLLPEYKQELHNFQDAINQQG